MTEICPKIGLAAADVAFKPKRKWNYFVFFSALCILHCIITAIAIHQNQSEGYLSLIFAILFGLLALGSLLVGREVAILRTKRTIRLRTGLGRICVQRIIPFENIRAIRLIDGRKSAAIELVCGQQIIRCPAAKYPRQQALMMSIAMDVKLIQPKTAASTAVNQNG